MQFYERKSTYLILSAGVTIFMVLYFVQSSLLGVERNIAIASYLMPTAVALTSSLIVAILIHYLQLKSEKEKMAFLELVELLAIALNEKDKYTHGHARRVMSIALHIASTMKLSFYEMELLRLSSILHDIGKIGIPDTILLKPEKLTQEEYGLIKEHPTKGARILSQINDEKVKNIIKIIKYHHERFDGEGYPEGIKGQNIPLLSRIIAVADSYDAMTSDRPYRKGMDFNQAIKKIKDASGTQFDPEIVNNFLLLFKPLNNEVRCSSFQQCEIFSSRNDAIF